MKKIESIEQYQELINRPTPTAIKYYTTWCPDCKNFDRFITDIVAERDDLEWVEMDAEQFQEIAESNEVRGIPSLLVYQKGEKIGHLHSKFAKTPNQVRDYLNELPL